MGKGVGLERVRMGLERRERVSRWWMVVRGEREERVIRALKARERFLRCGVGRGPVGAERLLEASERWVRLGKEGRSERICGC